MPTPSREAPRVPPTWVPWESLLPFIAPLTLNGVPST